MGSFDVGFPLPIAESAGLNLNFGEFTRMRAPSTMKAGTKLQWSGVSSNFNDVEVYLPRKLCDQRMSGLDSTVLNAATTDDDADMILMPLIPPAGFISCLGAVTVTRNSVTPFTLSIALAERNLGSNSWQLVNQVSVTNFPANNTAVIRFRFARINSTQVLCVWMHTAAIYACVFTLGITETSSDYHSYTTGVKGAELLVASGLGDYSRFLGAFVSDDGLYAGVVIQDTTSLRIQVLNVSGSTLTLGTMYTCPSASATTAVNTYKLQGVGNNTFVLATPYLGGFNAAAMAFSISATGVITYGTPVSFGTLVTGIQVLRGKISQYDATALFTDSAYSLKVDGLTVVATLLGPIVLPDIRPEDAHLGVDPISGYVWYMPDSLTYIYGHDVDGSWGNISREVDRGSYSQGTGFATTYNSLVSSWIEFYEGTVVAVSFPNPSKYLSMWYGRIRGADAIAITDAKKIGSQNWVDCINFSGRKSQ